MGQILSQFDDLRTLYTELTSASDPRAKIYVIGYPKFVGDNNLLCLPNAGGLSNTELSMINGSVEYFNNVIEAAAIASGVKYVDIENSLAGHKLCETGNHVTGITGLGGWRGNERQESFHPNAAGHSRIASTIQSMLGTNDLRSYHNPNCSIVVNTCPDSSVDAVDIVESSYFSGINPNENVQYAKMSFGDIIKGIATRFATGSNYFAPGSTINVTLYSDPTDLGDYSADGAGAFDETITIPSNVPTGYHTLTVSGETHSGEPIEYEQIIFVKNSSADTDNQLLYRVRNGDPNKQHNGAAEEANYLYIERNNYVAISSGLASDYDADGDGWSIVGASSGITYGSTSVPDISPYANFVIDEEDNMPMPYLYIRAGDHGCVKYKPTSLDEVEQGQVRTLTLVDTHTSSCRAQPGSDDLDFDGIADNVQPIYTARNGMSYLWEDPSKIYLFRSFHATEAQLGISDMNIGGTPFANPQAPLERFNKLAVSSGYIGNYNKLIILQDSEGAPLPTVLTKHYSTNECAAYHPTSTAMITYQDFQSPRSFIKLENLPEGEDCE